MMREKMIYNLDDFQYREEFLEKILRIIKKRHETLKGKRLFIGDSLVERIPVDFDLVNNGVGGMTSDVLLNHLDELVIKYDPKEVYLHIGTNDLGETSMRSPRAIALNVLKIFTILKNNLPNAKLFIISTLPSIDEIDSMFSLGRGIRQNALHDRINQEYRTYLEPIGVEYIDLSQYLYNGDKTIKTEYYSDGLHLNEEGYIYLKQVMEKEIKDRSHS